MATLQRYAKLGFYSGVEKAEEFAMQVRDGAYGLPVPEPLSLFDHVYVEQSPDLERQRSQYAAYLAMFDEEE